MLQPRVDLVAATEELRAGRRADVLSVVLPEPHPRMCQRVDVGRPNVRRICGVAVAQIVRAQVVREHEDDTGAGGAGAGGADGGGGGRGRRRAQRQ